MVLMPGDLPKPIEKLLADADDVYMGPDNLENKYCGLPVIWEDNPIPWRHGPFGILDKDEINSTLFRQIIAYLREKYKDFKPKSYNDAVKKLTGVSIRPQKYERRNRAFDEIVMTEYFPGKTEEEIIALYLADVLKLYDKYNSVIKRLKKLIKDSEKEGNQLDGWSYL